MGQIHNWIVSVEIALLLGFLYHHTLMLSCQAAKLKGGPPMKAHNLIPRFKIPHGNLSFFTNPHWEIFYFLKYGHFPRSSQANFNKTNSNFMTKLEYIKRLMEKNDPDSLKSLHDFNYGIANGNAPKEEIPESYRLGNQIQEQMQEIPEGFFSNYQGPLTFLPSGEVDERSQEIPEGFDEGNEEVNNIIKEPVVFTRTAKLDPDVLPFLPEAQALLQELQEGRETSQRPKGNSHSPASDYYNSKSFKTFLLEHDPNWVKARARLNSRSSNIMGTHSRGSEQGHNLMIMNPMSSRSGDLDDGSPPSMEGKGGIPGGKKFQTQGW